MTLDERIIALKQSVERMVAARKRRETPLSFAEIDRRFAETRDFIDRLAQRALNRGTSVEPNSPSPRVSPRLRAHGAPPASNCRPRTSR